MPSYYELLQVPPEATEEAISASCRWARTAVAHDPDRDRRLAAVDEARGILLDPDRRRAYDEQLAAGTAPGTSRAGIPLVAADRGLPPTTRGCEVCGATPTARLSTLRLTGLGVWFLVRFGRFPPPLCRDHGVERAWTASRHTMWAGWWGPSIVIVPPALVFNVIQAARFRRLGPPVPPEAVATGAPPVP